MMHSTIRVWMIALCLLVVGCDPSSTVQVETTRLANWKSLEPIAGQPSDQAADRSRPDRPIRVVATVGMVADLVRQVGGDQVEVNQLMGAGVDPHLYKVTRDDVRAIFAADVIFASGLMLEGKMAYTLNQLASRRPVIAVAELLDQHHLLQAVSSDHGAVDPHVWMDIATWAKTLPWITTALSQLKPSAAGEFHQRAIELENAMLAMHRYGVEAIATIPAATRHLITSHDAFAYFGHAYGLQVTGVQGISTDSEAGLLRINRLVDRIVDQGIRAVFVESSVPRKSLEAVIEGAQSRGHTVTIGGELFSDSAGPDGTYEGTYLGMMDHNLTIIATALGGTAPVGGFQGRLGKGKSQIGNDVAVTGGNGHGIGIAAELDR